MDTFDAIEWVITVIMAIFALFQFWERHKVQQLLEQESFHLFSSVALVLGSCQGAIQHIKQNKLRDALDRAASAEGSTQMLLQQTAKIVCHYHNPTGADIDNWISTGRIAQNYGYLFRPYSAKNQGWLRSTYRKISRRIL